MKHPLRILFLFKRYYMGKDVIADRYGRLFQFPYQLAQRGHHVTCLLSDYHLKSSGPGSLTQDGINWISAPVSRPGRLLAEARKAARNCDVIIGSSDCLQVCLASYLARKYGRPCLLDLYDNYESFGLAKIPLVKPYYRKAIRRADATSCIGDELRGMIEQRYSPTGFTLTLNSTIAANQFFPVDRASARESLGLPRDDVLVGLCGGLMSIRGVGYFYRAVQELWQEGVDIKLVLAGTPHASAPPPQGENTILLGNLAFEQTNTFHNAVNLNVLQYLDNEFGKYCYPQKLEEIVATGAPLVSASVGEMRRRFHETPSVLFEPEDVRSIKQAILRELESPTRYDTTTQSWDEVGHKLESALYRLSEGLK